MKIFVIGLTSLVLVACNGGRTPASTDLTVSGTATTGVAIAAATVTGRCKIGTGTATALADGTFSLVVTDGQLPCLLQITNPVDGTMLQKVVTDTGRAVNADITHSTEMAGQD